MSRQLLKTRRHPFVPSARLSSFEGMLRAAALGVALLCAIPIAAAIIAALIGDFGTWMSLAGSILPRATMNSLLLVATVAVLTAILGTATAWLVTVYRFPFSRVFEIALALPLAFPAYVLAYAYTDILSFPGAIQSGLRDLTGWGVNDYWFPNIRSLPGAALMFTFVLYPYVYLLARAAFLRQSPTAFQAARVLGATPMRAFLKVSAPLARPAIAGGVLLAVMEVLADYGTVAHFGVQTYATSIYQAWFSMGDRAAAAQLSLCLLVVVTALVLAERAQRGSADYHDAGRRHDIMATVPLGGGRALAAMALCLLPVLVGFVFPLLLLIEMAMRSEQSLLSPRYLGFVWNSITLASIAAMVTLAVALTIAFACRFAPDRWTSAARTIGRFGYAVPGSVIAVGLLVPFARVDNALDAFARETFGVSTGLFFTGSIVLLVGAYAVRFLAPALNAIDAGMAQIKPNMDGAGRTLGHTLQSLVLRVHLPLLRPAILTSLLIVFVDVMKELPATLIMRPFNYDTLAVQAHRLASDERLVDASVPSLAIVGFGLLPVVILCLSIARRPKA